MKQWWLYYYAPKSFEKINERIIYEFIGIRWFKKYLPTTGDLAMRKREEGFINLSKQDRWDALYQYEKKTRTYEWRHLLGFFSFILVFVIIGKTPSLFEWAFLILLNLYINIYPIFLQRYNRMRILDILDRHGRALPY